MYPSGVALNYDIVALDSISPTSHDMYNLGQHKLRYWRLVYTNEVRTKGVRFHDDMNTSPDGATYFTGSYNELRDLPDL